MKMLLLLLICFNVFAQTNEKSVTIPLKEYEDLRRQLEIPNVMVIEKLTLAGSFKGEKFEMKLNGRMIGKSKKEVILNNFTDGLKNCSGDGVFTLENSVVFFMPLKDMFKASCEIELSKTGNFSLNFLNVLYIDNQIADSESIIRKDTPPGINIDVLRKYTEAKKTKGKVIANGRYRVTVNPNITNFQYAFEFNNPNQNKEPLTIFFKNSEIIESIESGLNVTEGEKSIAIELNPGENFVTVNGHLEGSEFVSPLDSENQFFLIESHPLVQVLAQTKWRRISPSESGINPTQSNPKGFFINQEQNISWEIKKLNVFSSLGFSVSQANYLFYIPKKGRGIIEASFKLDNKGTPEIPFKIDGDILYAELDGQAIPMLKDDLNQLLITMNPGYHDVKFQYLPNKEASVFGGVFNLKLAKPDTIISNSSFNLRFDKAWNLIFANFSSDSKSLIGIAKLSSSLMFFIIAYILFTFLKTPKNLFVPILIPLSLLLLFKSNYAFSFYFILGLLLLVRYREKIRVSVTKTNLTKVAALVVLILIFFISYHFLINVTQNALQKLDSASQMVSNVEDRYQAPMMERSMHKMSFGEAAAPKEIVEQEKLADDSSQFDFEGIPARIEIPINGTNYYFTTNLIDAKRNIEFKLFSLKAYLINFIVLLLTLVTGVTIYFKINRLKKELLNIL